MQSYSFDIDSLPINVAIYEKDGELSMKKMVMILLLQGLINQLK